MRARGAHGQVLPLFVVVVLAAAGAIIIVARLGEAATARARARTAADAAALAGAADGRDAAETLAEANGARLLSFEADGDEVEVAVELAGTRATARARREPVGAGCAGSGRGSIPYTRDCVSR